MNKENITEWVSILKGLEIAELKEEDMPKVRFSRITFKILIFENTNFKFILMILKLKYISIILISIGLVLRTYHFSIGPVNGATLITLGVIALSIYCISKIINSDTYLLKVKFLSIMIMSIGGLFLIQSFQMYGLNGTMIVTLGLLPLLIYCIAKIIGK